MKIAVISDVHLGSAKSLYPSYHDMKHDIFKIPASINLFFLGDIFDFKNMKRSDVSLYRGVYARFKKTFDNIVEGNHEGYQRNAQYEIIRDGFFLEHGHRPFWRYETGDDKKSIHWETKFFNGLSDFKWCLYDIGSKIDEQFFRNNVKGREKLLDFLHDYYKNFGVHTVILGHNHPKEVCDFEWKGMRFIIVPRGITILDV